MKNNSFWYKGGFQTHPYNTAKKNHPEGVANINMMYNEKLYFVGGFQVSVFLDDAFYIVGG